MIICCLLIICHSIDNFHLKVERLFLVGKVSKKFFVAPKLIHEIQIFYSLIGKFEKNLK